MPSHAQHYESFIASAYAGPIFHLIEELESGRGTPNEVQASVFEYGYSASIIVLTVLLLESFLNISQHLMGSQKRSVRLYFARAFPGSLYQNEVTELFAIRDAIAHSHVWEGEIDPIAMKWIKPQLLPGYGDKAYD